MSKNIRWNLLIHGTPLVAGLVFVPLLFGGLGSERFGFLALAWAMVGYSGLLDLGLGRAITRSLAEGDARNVDRPFVLGSAITFVLLAGCLGALLIWLCARYLIGTAFKLSAPIDNEALASLGLFALMVPVVVIGSVLRGALEARQLFPLIATIRLPASVLIYAMSGFAAVAYSSLTVTALITLIVRCLETAFMFQACRNIYVLNRCHFALRWRHLAGLISFGSWLTVSNIIGPLMVYADRFFIAAVLSMSAVAFYTAAYDVVTRIWIITAATTGVLFPELSRTINANAARSNLLVEQALVYVAAAVFPLCLAATVIAYPFLDLWLGPDVARAAGGVFQIIAAGIFLNSIALVPLMLLHAAGRADVSGKLHVAEAPAYLLILYWALGEFGITGAAVAWTFRVAIDALMIIVITHRLRLSTERCFRLALLLFAYGASLVGMILMSHSSGLQLAAAAALLMVHVLFIRHLSRRIKRQILPTAVGLACEAQKRSAA